MKNLFKPKPYDTVITVPNLITAAGIILVVPYVWCFLNGGNRWIMFGSLFLSGCSDLFDGLCSRRLRQRTRLGEIIDPLRDRLICAAVLLNMLYLGTNQAIVWFAVIVIVALELLIAFVNYMSGSRARVHLAGKLRQAIHLLASGLVIISYYFNDVVLDLASLNFHFSLELALLIMASASCATFLIYTYLAEIRN